MTYRICKGSKESPDVAHHCILDFMQKDRAEIIVERNEGMKYLSGMIWRSFHSSTSPYHKIYRQMGKVHELYSKTNPAAIDNEYDHNEDIVVAVIQDIIMDMEATSTEMWYRATLFKMHLEEPNYSELHRQTGIPRTSISHAVSETKDYIKKELKKRNIDYDY